MGKHWAEMQHQFMTNKHNMGVVSAKKVGDKFECPICKKLYSSKGNMQKHRVLHQKNKLFSCALCNKGFTQKYVWKHHMQRRCCQKSERPAEFGCMVKTSKAIRQAKLPIFTGKCSYCKWEVVSRFDSVMQTALKNHMIAEHKMHNKPHVMLNLGNKRHLSELNEQCNEVKGHLLPESVSKAKEEHASTSETKVIHESNGYDPKQPKNILRNNNPVAFTVDFANAKPMGFANNDKPMVVDSWGISKIAVHDDTPFALDPKPEVDEGPERTMTYNSSTVPNEVDNPVTMEKSEPMIVEDTKAMVHLGPEPIVIQPIVHEESEQSVQHEMFPRTIIRCEYCDWEYRSHHDSLHGLVQSAVKYHMTSSHTQTSHELSKRNSSVPSEQPESNLTVTSQHAAGKGEEDINIVDKFKSNGNVMEKSKETAGETAARDPKHMVSVHHEVVTKTSLAHHVRGHPTESPVNCFRPSQSIPMQGDKKEDTSCKRYSPNKIKQELGNNNTKHYSAMNSFAKCRLCFQCFEKTQLEDHLWACQAKLPFLTKIVEIKTE